MTAKPRRGYVTYICGGSCAADVCPCTPKICDVDWEDDGDGNWYVINYDIPDDGYYLDTDPLVTPCVYGSPMGRGRHPVDAQGRVLHLNDHPDEDCLHEWAEGSDVCQILPYDERIDPGPPITLSIIDAELP